MLNKLKKVKGFTLIELIIVIAIIAILAAIAVPAFGSINHKAKVNTDISNARTIYSVVTALVADDTIQVTSAGLTDQELSTISSNLPNIPTPKAVTGGKFVYSVTSTGAVTVEFKPSTGADIELYPNTNATYGQR